MEHKVLDRIHYDVEYNWTIEELSEYFKTTKPRMLKCFRNLEEYGEIEFEDNVITNIKN